MTCKECKPKCAFPHIRVYDVSEIELCPRHALTDRLAEELRWCRTILALRDVVKADSIDKLLAEYDAKKLERDGQ